MPESSRVEHKLAEMYGLNAVLRKFYVKIILILLVYKLAENFSAVYELSSLMHVPV